jgi:hypothetical protein
MSVIDGKSMLEVLRDFVQKAGRAEMPYMITGSFAMSAYGEIRFTRDIDIVVEIEREKIDAFFAVFEKDYYVSANSIRRAVKNWVEKLGLEKVWQKVSKWKTQHLK